MPDTATPSTGTLSQITVYPIKSLPGVDVSESTVLDGGALNWDRRLVLTDSEGEFVTAKRTAEMHRFRAEYDLSVPSVTLRDGDSDVGRTFHLAEDVVSLGDYFSCLLDLKIGVRVQPAGGFPDDTEFPGPTIISVGTLEEIAGLFPEMSIDEAHRRLRANFVVSGVPAFWEDHLFAAVGEVVPFHIGSVRFGGTNPCRRCVVPSRNSETGETIQAFAKIFAMLRKVKMPEWTDKSRFEDLYRAATNTVLLDCGPDGVLRTGDHVKLSN